MYVVVFSTAGWIYIDLAPYVAVCTFKLCSLIFPTPFAFIAVID